MCFSGSTEDNKVCHALLQIVELYDTCEASLEGMYSYLGNIFINLTVTKHPTNCKRKNADTSESSDTECDDNFKKPTKTGKAGSASKRKTSIPVKNRFVKLSEAMDNTQSVSNDDPQDNNNTPVPQTSENDKAKDNNSVKQKTVPPIMVKPKQGIKFYDYLKALADALPQCKSGPRLPIRFSTAKQHPPPFWQERCQKSIAYHGRGTVTSVHG
ncbi:hypothetical protein X975_26807, partial [Stegodyphus mimosarum]